MRTNGGGRGRGFATRAGEKSAADAPRKGLLARRAAKGRPHMPLGRGYGRGPALATIAHEKSDLVHIPPRLVHVRGGVGEVDFFGFPLLIFARRGDSGHPRGCPARVGGRHPDLPTPPVDIPCSSAASRLTTQHGANAPRQSLTTRTTGDLKHTTRPARGERPFHTAVELYPGGGTG